MTLPVYTKPEVYDLVTPIYHIDTGVLTEFEQSLMTAQRIFAEMRAEVAAVKEGE